MLPLFLQHDVAAVSVPNYVSWFLDLDSDHYNLVQLPPIQRNAVWNIAEYEDGTATADTILFDIDKPRNGATDEVVAGCSMCRGVFSDLDLVNKNFGNVF